MQEDVKNFKEYLVKDAVPRDLKNDLAYKDTLVKGVEENQPAKAEDCNKIWEQILSNVSRLVDGKKPVAKATSATSASKLNNVTVAKAGISDLTKNTEQTTTEIETTIETHNNATDPHASGIAGKAASAAKLTTAQNINLTGDISGIGSFTGDKACDIVTKLNKDIIPRRMICYQCAGDSQNIKGATYIITSYTPFASSQWAVHDYMAWRAFSQANTSNLFWCTDGSAAPQWLAISNPIKPAKNIINYCISTTPSANQNPTSWRLEGSDDGINWVTLDTQTNITTGWTDYVPRYFSCTPSNYTYYRLYFTEVKYTYISMYVFQLFTTTGKPDFKTGVIPALTDKIKTITLSYTPTKGTTAIRVIGIGAGGGTEVDGGCGGGGFDLFTTNLATQDITVGSGGIYASGSGGTTSYGSIASATGGLYGGHKKTPGTGIIALNYIGIVGTGSPGQKVGDSKEGGGSAFALAGYSVFEPDTGYFPGGGACCAGASPGANGCVWIEEFGGATSEPINVTYIDLPINGKFYANVTCAMDKPITVGEIINYDPTDFFVDGAFVECPKETKVGDYYIKQDGLFLTAPVADPSLKYTDYNSSTKSFIENKEKKKIYLIKQLDNEYNPYLSKLKEAYDSAIIMKNNNITEIQEEYQKSIKDYQDKRKAISDGNTINLKLEPKFCIRCGTKLVDGICPKCGWVP